MRYKIVSDKSNLGLYLKDTLPIILNFGRLTHIIRTKGEYYSFRMREAPEFEGYAKLIPSFQVSTYRINQEVKEEERAGYLNFKLLNSVGKIGLCDETDLEINIAHRNKGLASALLYTTVASHPHIEKWIVFEPADDIYNKMGFKYRDNLDSPYINKALRHIFIMGTNLVSWLVDISKLHNIDLEAKNYSKLETHWEETKKRFDLEVY